MMNEYEVMVEMINPCGGSTYSEKNFIEVEAESPEKYIEENVPLPVLEHVLLENGDTLISVGTGNGYVRKYVFSKL